MDEVTTAYIAGFFDGEGCVSIERCAKRNGHGFQYHLTAVITQSEPDSLTEIITAVGCGKIYRAPHRLAVTGYYYHARFSGSDAKLLLTTLLPYLKQKKAEANLALDFLENARGDLGGKPVTPMMEALREHYWTKMQELKHGGLYRKRGRPLKQPQG